MNERYRGSTEYEIQKQLAEFAVYKGICMTANAVLALVFCLICGKIVLGIAAAVAMVLLAVYFYYLQSTPMELTYGKPITRGASNPVMVASWPAALCVTLLAAGSSGKLGSLWVWIAVGFGVTLLMQAVMWPQTRKHALEMVNMQDDADALGRLYEMVRDGKIQCPSCGKTVRGKCAIAYSDGKGAVLCGDCLPGKTGEWTELQGMRFLHVDTDRSSELF